MTERHAQSVFSGLGKNRCKTVGGEVVEFIDVEIEILASMLGNIRPSHCGKLKARHQQRPQKIRLVLAEHAFGKIGNEKPPVVHHESCVDFPPDLGQEIPHGRRHKKLPDFVFDRSDCFPSESLVISLEFIRPESSNHGVFDLSNNPVPIFVVGQHPLHAEQAPVD